MDQKINNSLIQYLERYTSNDIHLIDYFNENAYFKDDKFKLFDAGCSGGAADYWYKIKDLKILGIDFAKEEIERLEKNKKIMMNFFIVII